MFSGDELLEYSIKSIRNQVDYINVVYQEYSWMGEQANDNVLDILEDLKHKNLIDNIILFKFKPQKKDLPILVLKKKQLGIDDLLKNNCTHSLLMDVDEFYKEDEFIEAKNYIYSNNITHSCCPIYDYKKSPIYRTRYIRNYSVPFITQINKKTKLAVNHDLPCHVDSLRAIKYNQQKDKFYYFTNIAMHHMTGFRKDFDKKINNSITNSSKEGRDFIQKFKKEHEKILHFDEPLPDVDYNYIYENDYWNLEKITNEWQIMGG